MRKSKEIAQEVRKSLKGNLGNAGFTYFIYLIFMFLLSFGLAIGVEPFIAKLAQDKPIISAVILLVIEIVAAIIGMAIFYGCLVGLIKLKRGEKVSVFSCIPEGLKKIHKVFAVNFWISLKLLVWIVVLVGVTFGVQYLDSLNQKLYFENWQIEHGTRNIERQITDLGEYEYYSYKWDMRKNGKEYLEKNEWLTENGYDDEKVSLESKLEELKLKADDIEKTREKLDRIMVPVGITAIVLILVSFIMLTIQSYKYMLSLIILYDNPDLSGHKIVNKSRDMMKGRKGKLFGIQLKYVLLAILITILFVIVLGMIGMVFGLATYKICEIVYEVVATILLTVYMQMANICFYEEIISEEKEKELDEVEIV